MDDRLLTVDQVSEYLGVHRDTVYAMIRSGRLPALQLGGRKASWRISESDLQAFIAERKAAGGSNTRSVQSFEVAQAEQRTAFEREQERELEEFKSSQQRQRANFEAQQRARRSRQGDEGNEAAASDGAYRADGSNN